MVQKEAYIKDKRAIYEFEDGKKIRDNCQNSEEIVKLFDRYEYIQKTIILRYFQYLLQIKLIIFIKKFYFEESIRFAIFAYKANIKSIRLGIFQTKVSYSAFSKNGYLGLNRLKIHYKL